MGPSEDRLSRETRRHEPMIRATPAARWVENNGAACVRRCCSRATKANRAVGGTQLATCEREIRHAYASRSSPHACDISHGTPASLAQNTLPRPPADSQTAISRELHRSIRQTESG